MSELEQAGEKAEKLSRDLSEDRRTLATDPKHAAGVELLDAVRAAADLLATRLKKSSNQNQNSSQSGSST